MECTLKIINNGNYPGTIGWLAKNAHIIRIDVCKDGSRAAWLQSCAGDRITCLCFENTLEERSFGFPRWSIVSTNTEDPTVPHPKHNMTEAAMHSLIALAEQAIEIMEEQDQKETPLTFRLTEQGTQQGQPYLVNWNPLVD